jgi:tRNA A-37 threonylcarbamoyl transferase component Bud32
MTARSREKWWKPRVTNCAERIGFGSDEFRAAWSHGDAGTNNVIYDEKTSQVRLIDFEIVHRKSLPTKSRHADDLLVSLLDLLGTLPRVRRQAGAQDATGFNHLPRNQAGDSENQFAHARN